MQLAQWNPFREMDEMIGRFARGALPRAPAVSGPLSDWTPAVDISEKEKEYLVRAELPGVGKDDVKVEVLNGILTVSGERHFRKEDKDEKHHRIETSYGSFARSFVVPEDVAADRIAAECRDGVLCVHLPKAEARKPPVTQVKVN